MMKLAIVFALVALVAARIDVSNDGYHPISVGPAVIDFDPESIGFINRETLRALFMRILGRLENIRPRPAQPIDISPVIVDGFEPIDMSPAMVEFDSVASLGAWMFDILITNWPEGVPQPRSPPVGSIQELARWLRDAIRNLCGEKCQISQLPIDSIEGLLEFFYKIIYKLWPNIQPIKPESLESVLQFIVDLFRYVFPHGLPKPPQITPDAIDDVIEWIQVLLNRIQDYISKPPRPPAENIVAIREFLRRLREFLQTLPSLPRPITLEGFKDWIREIIGHFDRPIASLPPQPPKPAPTPVTSPLVQIIVNVKNAAGVSAPVLATPVDVVEDSADSIILPTPVVDAEDSEHVNVADELPMPEPVMVAPIVVAPAVVGPDTLN